MTIGIDLRVLQIGHQYRGIGEEARRTINGMMALAAQETTPPSFVFFAYDEDDPKRFLTIPEGLTCRDVSMGKRPLLDKDRSQGQKLQDKWRLLFGNPLPQARGCDVFVQYDYALGVPRWPKSLVFVHDFIPLVYWSAFFESPWTHVKHKAARTTLRTILHNFEYKHMIRRALGRARRVICISEHTKHDVRRFFHVPQRKLQVIHLGVSAAPLDNKSGTAQLPQTKPHKPFLLFIGAADPVRRPVDDLVAAFNNLKADGHDIQLVLVGENFQAPETIPTPAVRQAVLDSSYKEDILTMGYIDDDTKYQLYHDAVAFVFPSHYEGFGLPILEAMLYECPVISYKNSSIPEVGGSHALYAKNWQGIWRQAETLLGYSKKQRAELTAAAKKHATSFSWDKTAEALYNEIKQVVG
jgi:glycosyltransferase involved in cell wall biosynthesis